MAATAALEWITSQGLAASAGDPDGVWAVCEEAAVCLRGGVLKRAGGGGGGGGEQLLAWVLEAGQDKAVPLARMAAFRLLAHGGVVADCPVSEAADVSYAPPVACPRSSA